VGHRRCVDQLHLEVLDRLGLAGRLDWSRANVDSASVRAKRGDHVGRNPVDRGKPGSKLHLVCDGGGLPLTAPVTAANVNDGLLLAALLDDVPTVLTPARRRRSRSGKVDADRADDSAANRLAAPLWHHATHRGVVWSRPAGWNATGGGSSGRCRGCRATGAVGCGGIGTRRVVRIPAAGLRTGVLQAAVANGVLFVVPRAALLLHHRP
jgi:hypothetical protein